MGWQQICKRLRKEVGFTGRSKDRSNDRVYESQSYIKTDVFGFKHKMTSIESDGKHRVYRLMKHLYRFNRRLLT